MKDLQQVEAPAGSRLGSLRHRDFRLIWMARSVSVAGDRVWQLAIPTAAILVLQATPVEVGALNAVSFLAWPLLGLVAGVWVDRIRRRQILIATDIGRALVIATIPVAYSLGRLSLPHLFLVALLVGGMDVFFELAAIAHIPAVVPSDDWADANAKMEMAQQAISAAGPGAAGVLIKVASAPFALVADVASFVISAVLVGRTAPTPAPALPGVRGSLFQEAREGMRFLARNRDLLGIAITAGVSNTGLLTAQAVQLLFLYRVMHLSPVVVGIGLGAAAVGSLVSAAFNRRIMTRLGMHRTLVLSSGFEGLAWLVTPAGLFAPIVPLLIGGLALSGFLGTTWNVSVTTYRQRRVSSELMGRVAAASRMIAYTALLVGSLFGGLLGQLLSERLGDRLGLALTMAVGALIAASSAVVLSTITRIPEGAAKYS